MKILIGVGDKMQERNEHDYDRVLSMEISPASAAVKKISYSPTASFV